MFLSASQARRKIARNFASIDYNPDHETWRSIRMGVKRDLQAQRLRPNVPVPPRKNPLKFFQVMLNETGSLTQALLSFMHDGAWTSSGGSFRLAEAVSLDLHERACDIVASGTTFTYLEIGAAWAGLRTPPSDGPVRDIAGLKRAFAAELGQAVLLHFTNLTAWHGELEKGIFEHPYVTAAGLQILEHQGVAPASVDILYSQAAAYFETDYPIFLRSAARLLKPAGIMVFNHRPELTVQMDEMAAACGLKKVNRKLLGGMNGAVVRYDKLISAANTSRPLRATLKKAEA
ncbi:MAG: hypothetical protein ACYC10_18780 [Allorhizobium sp.]